MELTAGGNEAGGALPILPVALLLQGRPCLVVGAGKVAARKAEHLVEAGARVIVIGEHAAEAVRGMHACGDIWLEEREFADEDVAGCAVVFAATNDADANLRVLEACRSCGILCGCVDYHWREGDLISPTVLRQDDIAVAISTRRPIWPPAGRAVCGRPGPRDGLSWSWRARRGPTSTRSFRQRSRWRI